MDLPPAHQPGPPLPLEPHEPGPPPMRTCAAKTPCEECTVFCYPAMVLALDGESAR
jgi:hypothetical protein